MVEYLRLQWESEKRDYPFIGGLGVFLGPLDDGRILCGADLDSCIGKEGLEDWAIAAIEAVPGYWEISPSGRGLKLLAFGLTKCREEMRAALKLKGAADGVMLKRNPEGGGHAAGMEIYLTRRFFTVTGNALGASEICEISADQLETLRSIGEKLKDERLSGAASIHREQKLTIPGSTSSGGDGQTGTWRGIEWVSSDIRMTGAGSTRLRQLWSGDFTGVKTDGTRSAVAFALGAELMKVGFNREEVVEILATHPLTADWTADKGMAMGGRELSRILEKVQPLAVFGELPIVVGLSSGDPAPKKERLRARAKPPEGGDADEGSPSEPVDAAAVAAGVDWRRWLQRAGKAVIPNLYNARLALTWAPEWRDVLALNEFTDRVMLMHRPPYVAEITSGSPGGTGTGGERWAGGRAIRDNDRIPASVWLQGQGIQVGPRTVGDAMLGVAMDHRFNPVRAYLEGCERAWDGTRRLDTWLTRHMGADDTPYVRAVASMTMIGGVARVFEPGCKVDTMGVLEGNQGIFKSSALRALFGSEYFLDNMADLTSKDSKIGLSGKWGVEIAEMDKFSKAEISHVKVFLSTQFDNYRRPYGMVSEDIPRTCVIWGTINPGEEGYLTDETGNRRFWPVRCADRRIDIDAIRLERDQLWAEAAVRWRAGEHWWMDAHTSFQHEQIVTQRVERDSWHVMVGAFIAKRTEISITELLRSVVMKPMGQWNRSDQMRMARVLKMLGWKRKQIVNRETGEREWIYMRSEGIVIPFPVSRKEENVD